MKPSGSTKNKELEVTDEMIVETVNVEPEDSNIDNEEVEMKTGNSYSKNAKR